MADYKFEISQAVYFHPKRSIVPLSAPRVRCQIIRRLPAMEGEFQYLIRSTDEHRERVARESELTLA